MFPFIQNLAADCWLVCIGESSPNFSWSDCKSGVIWKVGYLKKQLFFPIVIKTDNTKLMEEGILWKLLLMEVQEGYTKNKKKPQVCFGGTKERNRIFNRHFSKKPNLIYAGCLFVSPEFEGLNYLVLFLTRLQMLAFFYFDAWICKGHSSTTANFYNDVVQPYSLLQLLMTAV